MQRLRIFRNKPDIKNLSDLVILDLCGGTGAWSKPWKEAGYDVRVVTLPAVDIHTYTEYRDFIDRVFFVLAAPDCTHMSFARSTAKEPRDIKSSLRLVYRCKEIIDEVMIETIQGAGVCRGWVIENPRGYLTHFLGPPVYQFHPWEFGADYGKETYLWGLFKPPHRPKRFKAKQGIDERGTLLHSRQLPEIPEDYDRPPGEPARKIKRAITPAGFATQFFKANRLK